MLSGKDKVRLASLAVGSAASVTGGVKFPRRSGWIFVVSFVGRQRSARGPEGIKGRSGRKGYSLAIDREGDSDLRTFSSRYVGRYESTGHLGGGAGRTSVVGCKLRSFLRLDCLRFLALPFREGSLKVRESGGRDANSAGKVSSVLVREYRVLRS